VLRTVQNIEDAGKQKYQGPRYVQV
jgi:hypothetical protein